MSADVRIEELGYQIEPLAPDELDNGRLLQVVRSGDLLFVSGQAPMWGDEMIQGYVGNDVDLERAQYAAKLCGLNGLRAIKTMVGSLDRVTRIVRLLGMVNVAADFSNTAEVIDGCSAFYRDVFGEVGRHARSAVGMRLPYEFAVEVEMIVEVAP